MARRARQNVEVIVERLASAGYRFHSNDSEQRAVTPYVPPTAAAAAVAGWLEERFGSVPMTLLSWLRLVGDVWLVGTHPHWAASAAGDPLVIELEGSRYPGEPMQRYFQGELEAWHEWAGAGRMFVLPVAPDRLHKGNVSGGPPYGIILPDGCADGLFVGETTMPFVSYLNWVFSNGGFPWPTAPENHWQLKKALAKDLLPLLCRWRESWGAATRMDLDREQVREYFTGDIALEAAHDLSLGLALTGAAGDVVLSRLMAPHADQADAPQGAVGLPVPAAVQPVPVGPAGRHRDRGGPAQPGEGRLGAEPVTVVPGGDEGWTGEAEGLMVGLAAANNKIAQADLSAACRAEAVSLGIPTYRDIAAATITDDPTAALRACAAGLYPLEAGTELLISHGTLRTPIICPWFRVNEFQMKSGFPPQDSIAVLSRKVQSSSARPALISKSRQSLAASLTIASS